jgi:hypothetical protein
MIQFKKEAREMFQKMAAHIEFDKPEFNKPKEMQ